MLDAQKSNYLCSTFKEFRRDRWRESTCCWCHCDDQRLYETPVGCIDQWLRPQQQQLLQQSIKL